jgi:hypothetical protein
MASVSFEKNRRRSGTVKLESNADSGLIIPFSQTLPVIRQILPQTRKNQPAGREQEKLGRIIDTLTGGSMAE